MPDAEPRVMLVPDLASEGWHSMDRYADRLLRHYAESGGHGFSIATSLEVDGITTRSSRPRAAAARPGMAARMVERYYRYPRRLGTAAADLYHVLDHSYGHLVPLFQEPTVVTVHDLLPIHMLREGAMSPREWLRNRFLKRAMKGLKKADAWLVGTEWMRGELAEWLGDDDQIFVVPFGLDPDFGLRLADARSTGMIRKGFGIPESAELLLHVGSTDPRKELGCLAHTLRLLRDRGRNSWLLQIGGDPDAVGRLAREQGVEGAVRASGSVPEEGLKDGYSAADLFVFPSSYEGFGFPLLEAMASSLPVVFSGAGGMAEVAGDAAVMVDSHRPDDYADAIADLLDSPGRRASLVARGLKRSATFNWAHCAADTAAVYGHVMGRQ